MHHPCMSTVLDNSLIDINPPINCAAQDAVRSWSMFHTVNSTGRMPGEKPEDPRVTAQRNGWVVHPDQFRWPVPKVRRCGCLLLLC